MVIMTKDYPETQTPKQNFVDVERAIGWLVNGLPDKGFTPLVCSIPIGLRGQPLRSAKIWKPVIGWLLVCLPW
jgi:hypothetical protein